MRYFLLPGVNFFDTVAAKKIRIACFSVANFFFKLVKFLEVRPLDLTLVRAVDVPVIQTGRH
jgi:hypothetical protein